MYESFFVHKRRSLELWYMDMENEWEKKTNIGFASVATVEGKTGLLKKLLLLLAAALSRYCIDRFSDQEREREAGRREAEGAMERRRGDPR